MNINCLTSILHYLFGQSVTVVCECKAFCKTDLKRDIQIKLSEIPSLSWLISFVTVHLHWAKCVSKVLVNIGQKLLTNCISFLTCLQKCYFQH